MRRTNLPTGSSESLRRARGVALLAALVLVSGCGGPSRLELLQDDQMATATFPGLQMVVSNHEPASTDDGDERAASIERTFFLDEVDPSFAMKQVRQRAIGVGWSPLLARGVREGALGWRGERYTDDGGLLWLDVTVNPATATVTVLLRAP